MNKTIKKCLSILLPLMMFFSMFSGISVTSHAESTNGILRYEIIDGEVTITGCDEYNVGHSNQTIPDTIEGFPVTSIGEHAFSYCYWMSSITIPGSVTSIGDRAFSDCYSLTSITVADNNEYYTSDSYGVLFNKDKTELMRYPAGSSRSEYAIPDSVTSIDYDAFYYCKSLSSITIPDSVTEIACWGTFSYCESLTSITVADNNEHYTSDSYGVLFNKDKTTLIQYPSGNSRSEYTIPDGVTEIGGDAFSLCKSLTSITIPNSITSIAYAFRNCKSLTNITIPDSVTSIGAEAFYECDSLTDITIPDSVTSIGSRAFSSCHSLTDIMIPDSVTVIVNGAFSHCGSLTSITIPDSVTSIGDTAFSCCPSLTSITVADNNKYYASDSYGVLFNKDKTRLVQYPSGSSRSEYAIPDSVTSLGEEAFYLCQSLTSITIPDSVTSLGERTFNLCKSLTSITIPVSITSIDDTAFYSCWSLTSVTIPDSVTSIGDLAFFGCRSLASITIPYSVTSIGDDAFGGCSTDNFTIYGYINSAAEDYANENGFRFVALQAPAHEHSYSEWTVTKEPTYIYEGEKTAICNKCGNMITETIEKLVPAIEVSDSNTGISVSYAEGAFDGEVEIAAVQEFDGFSFNILNVEKENFESQLFDITISQNGEKVQPNTVVLVSIHLPANYNPETTVVYYVSSDGTLEKMNSYVADGFIYFETTHFSSYAIVDESTNCSCRCHSENSLVRFFYRLARFFWKLFGMNNKRICACGAAHW